MRLTGQEQTLLNCGTFSLKDDFSGEPHQMGMRLVALGLAVVDEVEMVGETRFIATKGGKRAMREKGTVDKPKEEGLLAGVKAVFSGDEVNVEGSDTSAGAGEEGSSGEVP